MNKTRPKNLNLFTIRFPIPAIISILHRVSGVVLFLLIPLALWTLNFSLTESGFNSLHQWSSTCCAKFLLWLVLIPFCYHLVAGLRHLLMDIHVGDGLKAGRTSAIVVLILFVLLVILVGIWLW